MKNSLLLLICVCVWSWPKINFAANNQRTDTIDVTKYTLHLDVTNYSNHLISGYTDIDFICKKNNTTQLIFDLRSLQVDSVFRNATAQNFIQQGPYILLNLATALNANSTGSVRIYYHGTPYADATWGGFTFNSVYAFNLGVGFSSNPHNLGSAWFPCIDNFVDRSSYESFITTPIGYKAFCDGLLMDSVQTANNTTWHWWMQKEVATYLAGISVAPYYTKQTAYTSIAGNTIPVQIGCLPADSNSVNSYFQKLAPAFHHFESCFGPYQFEKIGYVLVPFNGGAMEHASNISIGKVFVTGGSSYESIYPHELSHMWFGDLVTCETEGDMWLNEGWALYCEKLFYEGVYNRARYIKETKQNHLNVLEKCHLSDGGFYAMTPIPHAITYGNTVYEKGGDMVHTLRSYMGDSAFFKSIKTYFKRNAWKSINSFQFRDSLIQYSGNNNLTNYFNDWIFQAGFPDIHLAQVTTNQISITVQKARHASHGYTKIPIELSFFDSLFHAVTKDTFVSEGCNSFSYPELNQLPFVATDFNELISDAVTSDWSIIKQTQNLALANAKINVQVSNLVDSVLLRVEHHWNRPDALKTPIPGLHLADRYWNVNGVFLNKLTATASINYNATASGNFIDKEFITNSEDSLVVLYRTDAAADWRILTSNEATVSKQGSSTNKIGQVWLSSLQKGEYTLGIYDFHYVDTSYQAFQINNCYTASAVKNIVTQNDCFSVFPSPSSKDVYIKFNQANNRRVDFEIVDLNGKQVQKWSGLDTENIRFELPNGSYFIRLLSGNCKVEKVVIQHY